jgi:hypothetical protein
MKMIWKVQEGITNSAGTFVIWLETLIPTLGIFFGKTNYIRNREL